VAEGLGVFYLKMEEEPASGEACYLKKFRQLTNQKRRFFSESYTIFKALQY